MLVSQNRPADDIYDEHYSGEVSWVPLGFHHVSQNQQRQLQVYRDAVVENPEGRFLESQPRYSDWIPAGSHAELRQRAVSGPDVGTAAEAARGSADPQSPKRRQDLQSD